MRGSLAAMIEPEISPWTEPELRLGFRELADAARREGHEFLFRMETEWREGGLRFDSPGECLFIARLESGLVGLSGICRDPYQPREDIGRLRHVYVDASFRSRGLGRRLVLACLATAGARFHSIRLKTLNPVAAGLYERIGFHAVLEDGEPVTHVLRRGDVYRDVG